MTKKEFLSIGEGEYPKCLCNINIENQKLFWFKKGNEYTISHIEKISGYVFFKEVNYGCKFDCFDLIPNSINFIKSL